MAGIQGRNKVLIQDFEGAKESADKVTEENQKLLKGNELLKQYLRSLNEKASKLTLGNKVLVHREMHLQER